MKRVEFRLSMPGRSSWNGKWSGQDKNYSRVCKLTDAQAERLLGAQSEKSWLHRWSDGWCACVTARVLAVGVRVKKSDGFSGYDWMIDNILAHGSTLKPGETAA